MIKMTGKKIGIPSADSVHIAQKASFNSKLYLLENIFYTPTANFVLVESFDSK